MPGNIVDTVGAAATLLACLGHESEASLARELSDILRETKIGTAKQLEKQLAASQAVSAEEVSSDSRVADLAPFLKLFGQVLKDQGAKTSGARLVEMTTALGRAGALDAVALRARLTFSVQPRAKKARRTGAPELSFDVDQVVAEIAAAENDDVSFGLLVKRLSARGKPTKQQVSEVAARYVGGKANYSSKQAAIEAIEETRTRRARFESHLSQIRR